MNKREWFEAWAITRKNDMTIKLDNSGVAWAGFWIGLGIVLAVAEWKGLVIFR